MSKDYDYKPKKTRAPKRGLEALLGRVPVHLFVNMVAKCGFSLGDAKDLCSAFKELK